VQTNGQQQSDLAIDPWPQAVADEGDAPERPFPLERRYRRRVLPLIGMFVVSLVALTGLAVWQTVRDVHLEFAARRVAEIVGEVSRKAPGEWQALSVAGASAVQREAIVAALQEAAAERALPQMKVYSPTGEALFSTEANEIGAVENNTALSAAIHERERVLLPHKEADGTRFNEFYIPVTGGNDKVVVAFELYEPAGYLAAILGRALVLPTLVPGLLLVGLIVALGYLIRQTQAAIDIRAARVRELSARLESLVSASAVGAVRASDASGGMALKQVQVSLLYADVRSFTSYSEAAIPEDVVAFLNRIMTLEIECVARHGGEVDKLIGDALLARFAGAEKERRAIAAAFDMQAAIEGICPPRGIGIGVFTGPAILGSIGPETRRDYTVIGDSVNIAARLCSEAARGEVICDAATLGQVGSTQRFGPEEEAHVRGREKPILIRRAGRRAKGSVDFQTA
jgi:class 3 adenylate cyclase